MRKIFRIQHKETGLGPFSFNKQIALCKKAIKFDNKIFTDIDNLPEVKNILTHYKNAIFGFTSEQYCINTILNQITFDQLNFEIKSYWCNPLYIDERSGQVIFLRPKVVNVITARTIRIKSCNILDLDINNNAYYIKEMNKLLNNEYVNLKADQSLEVSSI